MASQYRYFLGRITKGGVLSTEDLIDAILHPRTITKRIYSYTFTNIHYDKEKKYIYGRLAKFILEGEVDTIMPEINLESSVIVNHKIESSSPFLISLNHMGIAYPQLYNSVGKEQFERYFNELVSEKYENFFVSCNIEPIVDLRTFIDRVTMMTKIEKISVTVVPPNPLFGPVWEELKDYMSERESSELQISEKSNHLDGLKTNIQRVLNFFIQTDDEVKNKEKVTQIHNTNYAISDAAILMAVDGYGHAKIEGFQKDEKVIIKTKDNQKSFLFDKEPDIVEFYEIVYSEFEFINNERYLKH